MKQLTVEDAKQIELEILNYIDTLCKKHNINYIINYGTLIGAVRHEGFIPWDDDIDLSMPREDYQRFINIFQKEKSKYKLLSLETDKNYFNNFIKITDSTTKIIDTRNTKTYESGIFIDIFPIDRFDDPKVIDTCYKLESFKLLSFSKHKNIVYKDSLLKDWIRTAFWLLLDRFLLVILQIKSRKKFKNIVVKMGNIWLLSLQNLRKRKSSQVVPLIKQSIYPLRI